MWSWTGSISRVLRTKCLRNCTLHSFPTLSPPYQLNSAFVPLQSMLAFARLLLRSTTIMSTFRLMRPRWVTHAVSDLCQHSDLWDHGEWLMWWVTHDYVNIQTYETAVSDSYCSLFSELLSFDCVIKRYLYFLSTAIIPSDVQKCTTYFFLYFCCNC